MSTKRIRHTAKFKFQITIEAIKSDKTIGSCKKKVQSKSGASRFGSRFIGDAPPTVFEVSRCCCIQS